MEWVGHGPWSPSPDSGLMIGLPCHRSSLERFKPPHALRRPRNAATSLPSLPIAHNRFLLAGSASNFQRSFRPLISRVCGPLLDLHHGRNPRHSFFSFLGIFVLDTLTLQFHSQACPQSLPAASRYVQLPHHDRLSQPALVSLTTTIRLHLNRYKYPANFPPFFLLADHLCGFVEPYLETIFDSNHLARVSGRGCPLALSS